MSEIIWKCALYNTPTEPGFYLCQVQSAWSLNIIEVEFKFGKWNYPLKVLKWQVPLSLPEDSEKKIIKKAYWKK